MPQKVKLATTVYLFFLVTQHILRGAADRRNLM